MRVLIAYGAAAVLGACGTESSLVAERPLVPLFVNDWAVRLSGQDFRLAVLGSGSCPKAGVSGNIGNLICS